MAYVMELMMRACQADEMMVYRKAYGMMVVHDEHRELEEGVQKPFWLSQLLVFVPTEKFKISQDDKNIESNIIHAEAAFCWEHLEIWKIKGFVWIQL